MKRLWVIFVSLTLTLSLALAGCDGEETKCMELILEPKSFPAEDIMSAFTEIKEQFPEIFRNARLLSLVYSEEIQTHVEQEKLPEGEVMVVSVSIYGKPRKNAQDRADYYCVLTRGEHKWEIYELRLNRNPERFFERQVP